MRKLLFIVALLLYTGAHAQKGFNDRRPLEVVVGLGVPTNDAKGYAKAYLSIGNGIIGGTFHFGGDSRVKYGGEETGRGWLGGSVYFDLVRDRDWSFKPFLGIDWQEDWVRVESRGDISGKSFFQTQARKVNTEFSPLAGISVGWKFVEVTFNNKQEIFFGIKLSR